MQTFPISQAVLPFNRPVLGSAVSSMTHPSKELFHRQRALLRRPVECGWDVRLDATHGTEEALMEYSDSTFFLRMSGNAMRDVGLFDGDLLVVDRAIPAQHGSLVIAVVAGEFCVKQLQITNQGMALRAVSCELDDNQTVSEQEFSIWGVVRWSARRN